MNEPALLRYVPAWLPPDQWAVFTGRLAAAFDRYRAAHGLWSLSDAMVRGRVIGGVAAAFKGNRLDSAWGRWMLAKRGGEARLRAIAEAGEQTRAYFQALGRWGGIRSSVMRRQRARFNALAERDPALAAHAQALVGNVGKIRPYRAQNA